MRTDIIGFPSKLTVGRYDTYLWGDMLAALTFFLLFVDSCTNFSHSLQLHYYIDNVRLNCCAAPALILILNLNENQTDSNEATTKKIEYKPILWTDTDGCMEKLETQNKTVISHIENWFNEIQKKIFILNFTHSVASSCVNRVGILFCVQIKAEKFNNLFWITNQWKINKNILENNGKIKSV